MGHTVRKEKKKKNTQVSNGFGNGREKTKHFKDTERKQKYMDPEGSTLVPEIRRRGKMQQFNMNSGGILVYLQHHAVFSTNHPSITEHHHGNPCNRTANFQLDSTLDQLLTLK